MNVFECFEKSCEKNILFIGPDGYGKSTQLKNCCSKILQQYSNVVPLYIDLEASKVINNGIFSCIINKYCGELNKDFDGKVLLTELLHKDKNYRYVVFVDHFENAIKEEIYNRTKNEIQELAEYDKCSVIVASTYYDEKVFENFDKYEFQPLTKDRIIDCLQKYSNTRIDANALSDELINIISIPQYLYWFSELIKESGIENNINIHSDFDLLTRRFERCNNKEDKVLLTNILPKIATYCIKNNTKIVPYSELELLFKEKEDKLSFMDRLRLAVKHFFENDDDSIDRLNRFSKKYNIGELCNDSNKDVFRFSNQVYINYFVANFYGQKIETTESIEDLSLLNNRIINSEVCRFISLILKNKSKVIELLSQITEYNKNSGLLNENISLQDSKYLYLTANLINTYYYFDYSYEYANFSDLDLRLCNFIGKNCRCAFFNGSRVIDECFVPVEPEESTLFAISKDGKYFVTGNKEVINIRTSKLNVVIDRILADEDDEFIAINYVDNYNFELLMKGFIRSIRIINGQVSSSIKSYAASDFTESTNKSSVASDNISCYGEICCVENGYALIKSGEKSYFGKAYLLFDIETEKLISVHPYYSHLKTQCIVQDGDEIEFLPFNDGQPLKTICFNEKNKQIYKKQYPSMLGRIVEYKEGTKIYFDTNNCDSYLKYYLWEKHLEPYIWQQKNTMHVKINDIATLGYVNTGHIVTKRLIFLCRRKNDIFFKANYLSTTDYQLFNGNYINQKQETYNIYNIMEFVNEAGLCTYNEANINIIKTKETNGYYLLVGNKIYQIMLDEFKQQNISCVYTYEMKLTDSYVYAIDSFPWEISIKNVISRCKNDFSTNYLRKMCVQEVDFQFEIMKISDNHIFDWKLVFASFMTFYINNSENVLSNEALKRCVKKWCFPCDVGIIYYNGQDTVYLRVENDYTKETILGHGHGMTFARDSVHYIPDCIKYNAINSFRLVNIFKSAYENYWYSPRIPIYDLELFGASFNDVVGLSAVVEDILRKQTEIDTHTLTFDN